MRRYGAGVGTRAVTLVELIIAMAILSVLVLLLSSLFDGVNRAWVSGEQQAETFRDGRGILDLMSRELSQAVISPRLQLIQNPALPPGVSQRSESDSLFWQAPLVSNVKGSVCEAGYYLNDAFQLKRFFVAPDNAKFAIFVDPPTSSSAPWLTIPFSSQAEFDQECSLVADGVLALWIRTIDVNGTPIPWFSSHSPESPPGSKIRFNSGARFEPALPGEVPPTRARWPYTADTTFQAHRIPATIEITLVTLDSKTRARGGEIPAIPISSDPTEVPAAILSFNQQLIAGGIESARSFVARVTLANGSQ